MMKTMLLILISTTCALCYEASAFQSSNRFPSPPKTLRRRPRTSAAATSIFDLFSQPFFKSKSTAKASTTVVEKFFNALNEQDMDAAMRLVDEDVEFEDTDYAKAFIGKAELERNIRLLLEVSSDQIIVDDITTSSDVANAKIGILFHMQDKDTGDLGKKGTAFVDLDEATGLIQRAFVFKESQKSGEANLKILKGASKIIEVLDIFGKSDKAKSTSPKSLSGSIELKAKASSPGILWFSGQKSTPESSLTLPEQYFEAWNERDMTKACSVFADNVEYDDTAFQAPFTGKEALKKHLNICSDAFPPTFSFVVDDTVNGGDKFAVRWHVENSGEELPFTRGCSFYKVKNGKIAKGLDVVEPAVFKTRGLAVTAESLKYKLTQEPIRLVPLALWFIYMYVVFFSDWFFGLPATALEQRTWEEVLNLSLNFFFVSPILDLPFAPVVHPMLEGVFNLLLSWAALFAGFLSDDRRDKPNILPMLPMVAGMQFLTSAFLLPYLVVRSNETKDQVYQEDLSTVAQVTESKLLGPFLSAVGTGSIFWAIFARMQDFGGWDERLPSFLELLSIDRVGSSFLVDLAIFAMVQGWLVDDDLKRRGMSPDSNLAVAAKYIPFFGMAAYMTFRDSIPRQEEELAP